jgi:two-component system OmpR family sensor kinase
MVAHELATPLAAITNMAQIITLGALGPQEQRHAASKIQAEARILQLLVRDIQTSADVERDDFVVQVRPVALASLFDDAEAFARTVQEHHPLRIEPAPALTVGADPERIGQVIRNLLNNAVRHTPAGTPITLCARPQDGHVRIEVDDRGPGIDPADRALILEKFGRGAATGSNGRGLGLYVSQRIVRAHGADLLIESEPGAGARFSFLLEVC